MVYAAISSWWGCYRHVVRVLHQNSSIIKNTWILSSCQYTSNMVFHHIHVCGIAALLQSCTTVPVWRWENFLWNLPHGKEKVRLVVYRDSGVCRHKIRSLRSEVFILCRPRKKNNKKPRPTDALFFCCFLPWVWNTRYVCTYYDYMAPYLYVYWKRKGRYYRQRWAVKKIVGVHFKWSVYGHFVVSLLFAQEYIIIISMLSKQNKSNSNATNRGNQDILRTCISSYFILARRRERRQKRKTARAKTYRPHFGTSDISSGEVMVRWVKIGDGSTVVQILPPFKWFYRRCDWGSGDERLFRLLFSHSNQFV